MSLFEAEDLPVGGVAAAVGGVYARDAVADRFGRQVWEKALPFDARYMQRAGPEYQNMPNLGKMRSGPLGTMGELLQRQVYNNWGDHALPSEPHVRIPGAPAGSYIKPDIPVIRQGGLFGLGSGMVFGESKASAIPYPKQLELAEKPRMPQWIKNRPITKGFTTNQLVAYPRFTGGGLTLGPSESNALDRALDEAKKQGVVRQVPQPQSVPKGSPDNRWQNLKVRGVETGRWGTHIVPTPQLAGQVANRLGAERIAVDGETSKPGVVEKQLQKIADKDTLAGRAGNNVKWATGKVTGIPSRVGASVGYKVANSSVGKATVGTISALAEKPGVRLSQTAPVSAIAKAAGSPVGRLGGKLLGPVGTGLAIKSDIAKGDSVAKAVTKNGIGLGASIAAGAAVGTMIPVPVVGTVAGAAVGAAVGLGATKVVDKAWQPAAKGVGKAKKWLASKFATGGPVIGGLPSIDEAISSFVSRSGVNPAMSSVLEKAAGGLGDAAKAFVSGQSEDVGKTVGLRNGLPAAARAGAQAADLLRSGLDPSAVKASAQQSGSHAWSAAKQAIPAKALGAVNSGGDSVDQSMTINLQTPDVDTAFQKSKTWESQRALTYAGTW